MFDSGFLKFHDAHIGGTRENLVHIDLHMWKFEEAMEIYAKNLRIDPVQVARILNDHNDERLAEQTALAIQSIAEQINNASDNLNLMQAEQQLLQVKNNAKFLSRSGSVKAAYTARVVKSAAISAETAHHNTKTAIAENSSAQTTNIETFNRFSELVREYKKRATEVVTESIQVQASQSVADLNNAPVEAPEKVAAQKNIEVGTEFKHEENPAAKLQNKFETKKPEVKTEAKSEAKSEAKKPSEQQDKSWIEDKIARLIQNLNISGEHREFKELLTVGKLKELFEKGSAVASAANPVAIVSKIIRAEKKPEYKEKYEVTLVEVINHPQIKPKFTGENEVLRNVTIAKQESGKYKIALHDATPEKVLELKALITKYTDIQPPKLSQHIEHKPQNKLVTIEKLPAHSVIRLIENIKIDNIKFKDIAKTIIAQQQPAVKTLAVKPEISRPKNARVEKLAAIVRDPANKTVKPLKPEKLEAQISKYLVEAEKHSNIPHIQKIADIQLSSHILNLKHAGRSVEWNGKFDDATKEVLKHFVELKGLKLPEDFISEKNIDILHAMITKDARIKTSEVQLLIKQHFEPKLEVTGNAGEATLNLLKTISQKLGIKGEIHFDKISEFMEKALEHISAKLPKASLVMDSAKLISTKALQLTN